MRSYKQYCGVAEALDRVGQRWTLLLIRDLLPGPRRFTDLLLPGLTPNVLADRLKHLREDGLIEQVELPPPASRTVWQLTAEGRALEPVILALGAFGARSLAAPQGREVRMRWLLVSLMRRYTGGLTGTVGVRVDGAPYTLTLELDRLTTRDGWPDAPDLVLEGSASAIGATLGRGGDAADLRTEGDTALLVALRGALGVPSTS